MRFVNRDGVRIVSLKIQKINEKYQQLFNNLLTNYSLTEYQLYDIQWKIAQNPQFKANPIPYTKKQVEDAETILNKLEAFYTDEDVKAHLALCYGFKCCYCESRNYSTSFLEVEHYYPKTPVSSILPSQFQVNNSVSPTKAEFVFYNKNVINDVRNYHISCRRCNTFKRNFVGKVVSPNYFHSGIAWDKTSNTKIQARIWYEKDKVRARSDYIPFIKALKMNGEDRQSGIRGCHTSIPLYSSLLLERTRHLEKVRKLLRMCLSLSVKGDFANAKTLCDYLYEFFLSNAHFSTMINQEFGPTYRKIRQFLRGK